MATQDLTLKNYQKQLRDNIKAIYDNLVHILGTKTEHLNFEVQVKSAEIVRSYQSLMQLLSEIRTFLIINDQQSQQSNSIHSRQQQEHLKDTEKLVRLRDEMAMFLYELEMARS